MRRRGDEGMKGGGGEMERVGGNEGRFGIEMKRERFL